MRRVAVGVLVVLAACGHHDAAPAVPTVVGGPASAWAHITVTAGERSVEVPADLRGRVAPLRASRDLPKGHALSEYGLDRPQAQVSYRADGRAADVLVGSANFDRHFFYAKRPEQPGVYLLPADSLRPVLALVGIQVAPPG